MIATPRNDPTEHTRKKKKKKKRRYGLGTGKRLSEEGKRKKSEERARRRIKKLHRMQRNYKKDRAAWKAGSRQGSAPKRPEELREYAKYTQEELLEIFYEEEYQKLEHESEMDMQIMNQLKANIARNRMRKGQGVVDLEDVVPMADLTEDEDELFVHEPVPCIRNAIEAGLTSQKAQLDYLKEGEAQGELQRVNVNRLKASLEASLVGRPEIKPFICVEGLWRMCVSLHELDRVDPKLPGLVELKQTPKERKAAHDAKRTAMTVEERKRRIYQKRTLQGKHQLSSREKGLEMAIYGYNLLKERCDPNHGDHFFYIHALGNCIELASVEHDKERVSYLMNKANEEVEFTDEEDQVKYATGLAKKSKFVKRLARRHKRRQRMLAAQKAAEGGQRKNQEGLADITKDF